MYKLREISKKDIEEINKWRNDKELISKLGAPYRFIDISVDEKWYEQYLNSRENTIRCAIVEENQDEILGLITLSNINYINRNAILHIMIGNKKNRGKGIGKFAIKEILDHAFNVLNLERIELQVLEDNEIAKQVYEKIGFKEEGIKRKCCFKDGKYKDMIVMSVLKEEF